MDLLGLSAYYVVIGLASEFLSGDARGHDEQSWQMVA